MSTEEFIKELGKDADARFDQYFDFIIKSGIGKKLSLKDIRDIFFYFKENWRQAVIRTGSQND
jgi:hypothetical protein